MKREAKAQDASSTTEKKESVLPEDEYMERLGSIIERFLPDLTTERRRGEDEIIGGFVREYAPTEDNDRLRSFRRSR